MSPALPCGGLATAALTSARNASAIFLTSAGGSPPGFLGRCLPQSLMAAAIFFRPRYFVIRSSVGPSSPSAFATVAAGASGLSRRFASSFQAASTYFGRSSALAASSFARSAWRKSFTALAASATLLRAAVTRSTSAFGASGTSASLVLQNTPASE